MNKKGGAPPAPPAPAHAHAHPASTPIRSRGEHPYQSSPKMGLPPFSSSQHDHVHTRLVGDKRPPFPGGLLRVESRRHYDQYCTQHPPISSPGSDGGGGGGGGGSDHHQLSSIIMRTTEPTSDACTRNTIPQPDVTLEADRRLRRLLSNRVSAQKSRLRRIKYINEMETQVKEFEAEIAQLTPEVILTQRKKKLLQMDNEIMEQKKLTLQERISLKNAETEGYRTELYQLRHLFELQQQQKQGWMVGWGDQDYNMSTGDDEGRRMYEAAHTTHNWAQPQQQFGGNPNMYIRQPSAGSSSEIDLDGHMVVCEACRHGQQQQQQ